MTGVLVAGIGNRDRGDDAIGPIIAERLAPLVPGGVRVIERAGDMSGLLDDWAGFDSVVLVDAAATAAQAGRVHRIDIAHGQAITGIPPCSTHALGVADTVALARALGLLPRWIILYVIEAESFEVGTPVTPAVLSAAGDVILRILDDIQRPA